MYKYDFRGRLVQLQDLKQEELGLITALCYEVIILNLAKHSCFFTPCVLPPATSHIACIYERAKSLYSRSSKFF